MAATGSGVLSSEETMHLHRFEHIDKNTASSSTASGAGEFDAFSKTEVELAKAKRVYQSLEKRLDQERHTFQDKANVLQGRIYDLERCLHQTKVDRLAQEEEARERQTALEAERKRERTRNILLENELHETKESWVQRLTEEHKGWQQETAQKVDLLRSQMIEAQAQHGEELRETKDAWVHRLGEEGKAWQQKVTERVTLLQGQIDEARNRYTSQIKNLQEDLREALAGRGQTQEELDVTKTLLHEEETQRRTLQLEVEEFKGKYRRCMELAAELINVRNGSGASKGMTTGKQHQHQQQNNATSRSPISTSTAAGSSPRMTATPVSITRPVTSSPRLSTENDVLKKQLKLTQVLLDEELRKNHSLRQSLSRLNV